MAGHDRRVVMVVEDDEVLASLFELVLRDEGFAHVVTWTHDFDQLLTDAPWRDVHIALVDLMLPQVSGEDILRYLALHHPEIRRIVLSAVAHMRPEVDELADAVLTKPATPFELRHALGGFK